MEHNWKAFEDYVQRLMEKEHIPGVAVAAAQNGETIYQKGFGFRNLETQAPVTPDTIFGTASVTKSFTAAAIMELEKEGKLSVTDPVIKYIPEFFIPGTESIPEITIHHLLSHTTGLPPIERKEEIPRLNHHLDYLAGLDIDMLGKPGEYFSYSNDAFLLLGLIIERVTGRLYRRYMTERFLDQLSMRRSTFSVEELTKFSNVTVPYTYQKATNSYITHEWPTLGNYEVGGGIRSTVLDLLKYGEIFTNHVNNYISRMWEPVHPIFRNVNYGYALTILDYEGVKFVKHSGGQSGVSSHFGFIPNEGITIAVLTNVSDAPADEIWLAMANMMIGLPVEHRVVEPEGSLSKEEANQFVGVYAADEGGRLEIINDHDGLGCLLDGERYDLRPSDAETLVIREWQYPIPFTFRDNKSKPWAAFFGMRLLQRSTN